MTDHTLNLLKAVGISGVFLGLATFILASFRADNLVWLKPNWFTWSIFGIVCSVFVLSVVVVVGYILHWDERCGK